MVYYCEIKSHKNVVSDSTDKYRRNWAIGAASVTECFSLTGNVEALLYFMDGVLHRMHGPSYIKYHDDGSLQFLIYRRSGNLHREDGPAEVVLSKDCYIMDAYYYLHDIEYSCTEYRLYLLLKNDFEALKNTYTKKYHAPELLQ